VLVEASNQSYQAELDRREKEFQTARRNESIALTELALNEVTKHPLNAAKLALAAWPRDSADKATPKLSGTIDVLGQIVPNLLGPDFGPTIAILKGHKEAVFSAAFSRDGINIVTASWDKTARLWEVVSGCLVATLSGHEDAVTSASFSSDAMRIITASVDKTARIWDVAASHCVGTLFGHQEAVLSAAFSPDGVRIVTASQDKTARLWDAVSRQTIATLVGHTDALSSAAFSPDGMRIVTASKDGTVRLWDAASRSVLGTLIGHEDEVTSAAFDLDGRRIVTASRDKTARLWDAASGQTIATLAGHTDALSSAAFSRDGMRIVTASSDKTACLWDTASGRTLARLAGHNGQVLSAAFSPDGTRVVTASEDRTARVWDVSTIPDGHILQIACKLLAGNFGLDGVTGYPLTLDRPICASDPPPPDLVFKPADSAPARVDHSKTVTTAARYAANFAMDRLNSRDQELPLKEAWNEYRGWAKRARDLQAATERWNLAALTCVVSAPIFGAVVTFAPDPGPPGWRAPRPSPLPSAPSSGSRSSAQATRSTGSRRAPSPKASSPNVSASRQEPARMPSWTPTR
jgi:WD40 repeat protein